VVLSGGNVDDVLLAEILAQQPAERGATQVAV